MNGLPDMVRCAARARTLMEIDDADAVAGYLLSRAAPDGGFRGRGPESDLYYTLFALAALLALGRPAPETLAPYLDRFDAGAMLDFVHLAALIRCSVLSATPAARRRAAAGLPRLETFRTAQGGYRATLLDGEAGSVYGAYLAWLAYGETAVNLPDEAGLRCAVESLRAADGGFANAPGMAMGVTPATAAGLLLLRAWTPMPDAACRDALLGCECRAGGFLAYRGAPAPDLLSTATALYALRAAGSRPSCAAPHLDFIEALWEDDGGFRGALAESVTDCEYTFYALLAMGALAGG